MGSIRTQCIYEKSGYTVPIRTLSPIPDIKLDTGGLIGVLNLAD